MIKEAYVSSSMMKLLKEKGFSFDHVSLPVTRYETLHNDDGTLEALECITQQLALAWLREKHGIFIGVNAVFNDLNETWEYELILHKLEYPVTANPKWMPFTTYESAVNEGIVHTLNFLI